MVVVPTAARTAAVSGATVMARPRPSSTVPGRTAVRYRSPGPTWASQAMPAAVTSGPTVIGSRAPMRWARAPLDEDSSNMSTVIGSSPTPASSAE